MSSNNFGFHGKDRCFFYILQGKANEIIHQNYTGALSCCKSVKYKRISFTLLLHYAINIRQISLQRGGGILPEKFLVCLRPDVGGILRTDVHKQVDFIVVKIR